MHIANVTAQGQVSIPAKIRKKLDLAKKRKVFITEEEGKIVMEPVKDFLELGGSFKTSKKVSSQKIRQAFEEYLAKEAVGKAK